MSALLQKAMPGNVSCCVPVRSLSFWIRNKIFIRVILYISYKRYGETCCLYLQG
jgi:hypothetical protein